MLNSIISYIVRQQIHGQSVKIITNQIIRLISDIWIYFTISELIGKLENKSPLI